MDLVRQRCDGYGLSSSAGHDDGYAEISEHVALEEVRIVVEAYVDKPVLRTYLGPGSDR